MTQVIQAAEGPTKTVGTRLLNWEAAWLVAEAELANVSLSELLRHVIRAWLGARGHPKGTPAP